MAQTLQNPPKTPLEEQPHDAKHQANAKPNCQRVTQHRYRPWPLSNLLLLLAAHC
jgi:hypothetical protein